MPQALITNIHVSLLQDIVGQDVSPKVIEELLGWKHEV